MMYRTYHDESKRRMWFWLLLSLILHLFLVVLFIDIERPDILNIEKLVNQITQAPSAQSAQSISQPQMQPPQPNPLDAEEVPFVHNIQEDSHFGAPVIFQDAPESTSITSEQTEDGDVISAVQDHEQQAVIDTIPHADDETTDAQDEQPESAKTDPQDIPLPVPAVEQIVPGSLSSPMVQEKNEPQVKKKKRRRKRKRTTLHTGTVNSEFRDLTLSKFAAGFLDCVKSNKHETIDIKTGDLKYSCYMQKILWYLQNASHLYSPVVALTYDLQTHAVLHLEINEDGRLLNSYLSPTTGVQKVDEAVVKMSQTAGPFPPLPKHFNRQKLKINMNIAFNLAAGTYPMPNLVAH